MTTLIAFYWYGLLIAFGIGLLTGRLTWARRPVDRLVEFDPDETADLPEAVPPSADADPPAVAAAPVADPVRAPDSAEGRHVAEEADVAVPLESVDSAQASAEVSESSEAEPIEPAREPLAEPDQTPDDLLRIKGIGPALARLLNSLGVRRFDDIASWKPEDIELIDSHLGEYRGRIIRDEWIQQASLLAKGDVETFKQRYGHRRF